MDRHFTILDILLYTSVYYSTLDVVSQWNDTGPSSGERHPANQRLKDSAGCPCSKVGSTMLRTVSAVRLYTVLIGSKVFREDKSLTYAKQAVKTWNAVRSPSEPRARFVVQT